MPTHQHFVCNTLYNMNYHKSLCIHREGVATNVETGAPKAALERNQHSVLLFAILYLTSPQN